MPCRHGSRRPRQARAPHHEGLVCCMTQWTCPNPISHLPFLNHIIPHNVGVRGLFHIECIMRMTGFALCGALALATPPAAAAGEIPNGYVLGDSLGEGVADVSHLHKLARISVHIRGPRALEQFAQTPPNATVFLVLGTNDANGTIAKLDRHIDNILNAAAQKNITLIWLGPPCVRPYWDSRARELDHMLQARFAGTAVTYVSMRDAELCSGGMQEPDGVHLKIKGYV